MLYPVHSYFFEAKVKKKKLSAARKSELCLECGKCCMAMTFYGGEVDDEVRDEIYWMELHGFKIDYAKKRGDVFLAAIHIGNLFGPPPSNVAMIAWAGHLQWLFVLWAYWVDRNRVEPV